MLALRSIEPPTVYDRLVLARTYAVDHWIVPALTALCERTVPLRLDEARGMSMEDVILVATVREDIRGQAIHWGVSPAEISSRVEAMQAGRPWISERPGTPQTPESHTRPGPPTRPGSPTRPGPPTMPGPSTMPGPPTMRGPPTRRGPPTMRGPTAMPEPPKMPGSPGIPQAEAPWTLCPEPQIPATDEMPCESPPMAAVPERDGRVFKGKGRR